MNLSQSTSILNRINLALVAAPARPRMSCIHAWARDRVIDFGKYKGRMLGTLPSTYLRWVSKNLRAGDFDHWAGLADQVLQDPVYADRIDWEFAKAVLNGDNSGRVSSSGNDEGGAVAELLEISERFGWDNEDKAGWSKVNFELLGTSRGGRIPRVGDHQRTEARGGNWVGREGKVVAGIDERRKGRRERTMKMKKEKVAAASDKIRDGRNTRVEDEDEDEGKSDKNVYTPFPGREALLRKVLITRRRSSLRCC